MPKVAPKPKTEGEKSFYRRGYLNGYAAARSGKAMASEKSKEARRAKKKPSKAAKKSK